MSSLFGRVLGAVGALTGRNKASSSHEQDLQEDSQLPSMAESKNAKKRLFDDDDEETGADVVETPAQKSSFTVNADFARRFEHNNKRAEKQKLEEKYGRIAANNDDDDSTDESTDESEDEDGYLLTEDLDARMTAALQAIKNKDPRIYDADTKFFDPTEIDQLANETAKAEASDAKQKPMFLRDYHRERYLRGDVGADEDEDDATPGPKTYQQEQDDIKQALISEMNAAQEDADAGAEDKTDDVDAFIRPKAASKAAKDAAAASGMHPSRAARVPKITEADVVNADKNPELFLSNFLASRAWVPDDDEGGPGWQAFESDDDDGAANERAEQFETAYNLRFEDPTKSNEVLKSYSRSVVAERSVRREAKTARQRQRDAEKEEQAAAKRERHEERARLRKLRVEEAQEKLAKIRQAAGIRGKDLAEDEWEKLIDDDAWDLDKWEAEMQKKFGDGYYAQPDAEVDEDADEDADAGEKSSKSSKSKKSKKPKKPKWDDDIDIQDIVPDFEDAAPTVELSDLEVADEDEDEDEAENDSDDDGEQPAKRRKTAKDRKQERADAKRQARRERARIEAIVDRKLELEAPEALDGKTAGGFRYRETSPQSFGLTARDILLAPSDTVLNEFAGLKKLATFRDEERKRKDRKKLGKKARLRQWRRDTFGADYEMTGPTYGFERLVGETAAEPSRHKHKGSKDKGKGKEKAQDADTDKSGKKRKRSGRKGKGKAADTEA